MKWRSLLLPACLIGALIPASAWCQPPALLAWWYCSRAMGMALDDAGTLYVASFDSHRIYRFTENGGSLGYWGEYGAQPWNVTGPSDVALDGSGRIFVAEATIINARQSGLQVFTTDGVYIASWGVYGYSHDPGFFVTPFGVAFGPDRCLYVADAELNRVQVFTSDGVYVREWSTPCYGITINDAGDVYVADARGNRVRKFTSMGALLTEWGSSGSGPAEFREPHAVAVDTAGNVYVADTYNHRVQVFSGDGGYLTEWGGFGYDPGQFYRPMGVLVDGAGNVYVADTWNGRVQKFGFVPTPARTTTWGNIKARYR